MQLSLRFTEVGIKFLSSEFDEAELDVILTGKTHNKHITDPIVANGLNPGTTINTELRLGHLFALERSTYPASFRRRLAQDSLRAITS